MKILKLKDFKHVSKDKIRYGDTDRQGHVNNSVFATFLETGRVEILINDKISLYTKEDSFVIVNMNLDFVNEVHWPGEVIIGTGILKIGNSSLTFYQNVYQDDLLVASASTVIVKVDAITKKSKKLSEENINYLKEFLI